MIQAGTGSEFSYFFHYFIVSFLRFYPYQYIVHKCRYFGIAALLLDEGRISYSCFKIPLSIHEDSVAGLKRNSYMFPVLQQTKVIIWDKVSIQHKYDINTVDQCLRDLLKVSNHLHLIALKLTCYLE